MGPLLSILFAARELGHNVNHQYTICLNNGAKRRCARNKLVVLEEGIKEIKWLAVKFCSRQSDPIPANISAESL